MQLRNREGLCRLTAQEPRQILHALHSASLHQLALVLGRWRVCGALLVGPSGKSPRALEPGWLTNAYPRCVHVGRCGGLSFRLEAGPDGAAAEGGPTRRP